MLDFYGFELADAATGRIARLADFNFQFVATLLLMILMIFASAIRFKNLNTHSHNYLRVTRILKCLGELDYEHYKACCEQSQCMLGSIQPSRRRS